MSVGSFVLSGVGGGSTVALFITEGYGVKGQSPPANVVLGGIPKRRGKRFEITINDQKFVAASVPALEAIVLAWRKAHPANDTEAAPKAKPKPIPTPAKRIPETVVLADAGAQTPSGPEWRDDRGTILAQMPKGLAEALRAETAREAEAARLQAEEEDDMEALMAILRAAA